MKTLRALFPTLCVAVSILVAKGSPIQTQQEDCDGEGDQQRVVNNQEFIHQANGGYRHHGQHSANLETEHGQSFREQYHKLKQKADQFVNSPVTYPQDLGVDLTLGGFNKLEGGSQLSSSHHQSSGGSSSGFQSSGVSSGIRTPVATNFYNNDGSLLHTVEGLKAHGQGVQFTATGGIAPLKNYQEGQVYAQNSVGGYGSSFEKHSSSHSEHASSSNAGIPQATITYTPTGWEKHHQSSSINVQESIKKRNFTDFLEPELISQKTSTVIHPLNVAYGAQSGSVGSLSQSAKTHANYDQSSGGSYGLYQVPMTVIPVLGGNDANYLSETKSQSHSKTFVSSHDAAQSAVDAKPIKIQTGSYVRPSTTPSGVDEMWHKLVQGQTSQVGGQRGVLQTSFGTTESETEEHLNMRPIALTAAQSQNAQYTSKSESQQSHSASSSSSYQQSGSTVQGQGHSSHAQSQSQIKGSSSGRVPANTFVGNPNAPQNSGYAITGENKGFYAKSVELANLLSATIAPMEDAQSQVAQESSQQSSSSSQYGRVPSQSGLQTGSLSSQQQSGLATGFIEKERNPSFIAGGKTTGSGFKSSYEKQQSSSSQFEKTQSQNLGGQESYSGVPVINEPYRGSGSYHQSGLGSSSSYDWSQSGSGYGQYGQQKVVTRPISGYGTQQSGSYGGGQSSNFQSWQQSAGSQKAGSVCGDCSQQIGNYQYGYGTPQKSSYGLSSQFASSSSDINGQKSESKSASVTINDNGKVDTYSRHNK